MKAWTIESLNGLGGLKISDVAEPVAAKGEVVVSVELAALNPADRYLAEGAYPGRPAFPHILGRDAMGKISALGEGVSDWKIGDEVVLLRSDVGVTRWGSFAEKVAVPASHVARAPAGWTREESAAAPLVYLTAYQALTQWDGDAVPMPKGGIVLVSGASGGVGVPTVQLGKGMGYRVIGLSRSKEKGEKVISLGAERVYDIGERTWSKKLREDIKPAKVDLAVDNIGGELLPEMIDCLAMNGRVSLVGRLGGPVPNFNPSTLFFRRLRMGGVAVATFSDVEMRAAWETIVKMMDKAKARPVIDAVFGFADLPAAFERLNAGPMGKVLVRIAG